MPAPRTLTPGRVSPLAGPDAGRWRFPHVAENCLVKLGQQPSKAIDEFRGFGAIGVIGVYRGIEDGVGRLGADLVRASGALSRLTRGDDVRRRNGQFPTVLPVNRRQVDKGSA